MEEVKLFGTWPSAFSHRVIWALKLKGVEYEYMEEDLSNKSPLLLQYNPVHKKIPVLVHGGKPIAESLIILEYIDETWPENPMLPKDPYDRAVVRFWAKFIDEKTRPMRGFFETVGEEKEKAIQFNLEVLQTIEEHGLGGKKFLGGETIGIADIALGWIIQLLDVMEEIAEIKFIEEHSFPCLYAWMENFKQVPVIKENLFDRDKMLVCIKGKREMLLASSYHHHHHH